jgi:uncharacterized protein DUF3667
MSGHSSAGRSHCQNCGAALTGPYCAACGQHDVDYHRSLWPILEDSLEGLLHLDGKFLRTVRLLFTRPGLLTREFIAGRRVAYTQPLRLYIFASFLYFALSLVLKQPPSPAEVAQANAEAAQAQQAGADGREAPGGGADARASAPSRSALGRVFTKLQHQDGREVEREMRHLSPTMAFFCLPLLATVLCLAYRGSGQVYVEHLIFALHVQTFFFLAALATDIAQAAARLVSASLAGFVGFLCFLWGASVIYRAFRAVYGQGRWKTLLKMALVGLAYGIVLILGVSLTAISAALLVLGSSQGAG